MSGKKKPLRPKSSKPRPKPFSTIKVEKKSVTNESLTKKTSGNMESRRKIYYRGIRIHKNKALEDILKHSLHTGTHDNIEVIFLGKDGKKKKGNLATKPKPFTTVTVQSHLGRYNNFRKYQEFKKNFKKYKNFEQKDES